MTRFPALSLFACVLLLFLVSNCSRNQCAPECPCESGPLTPLCVGDTWVYEVFLYSGGPPVYSRQDTLRITALDKVGTEEYYLTNRCFAFQQTSDGLSFACCQDNRIDVEIFLRTPTAESARYSYFSTRARAQSPVLVNMTTEGVVTPSGTYAAFTYRTYLSGPFLTLSFARSVGPVKMVDLFGDLWLLSSVHLVEDPLQRSTGGPGGICGP